MKIKELLTGILIPVTNEESEILSRFNESTTILKSDLDEREQLLMSRLVSKDVVSRRTNNEGKIVFAKKVRGE